LTLQYLRLAVPSWDATLTARQRRDWLTSVVEISKTASVPIKPLYPFGSLSSASNSNGASDLEYVVVLHADTNNMRSAGLINFLNIS
jgi:hypothetical protein